MYELFVVNTVDNWVKAIPELKGKLTRPFGCLAWDTWTEVQWTLSTELRRKNNILGKGLVYRDGMQIQHWGQMTDLNKLAIASFKDLPIESLFLMQAEVKEDAVTHTIVKGPSIHGKLVTEVPAMFNTIIYTYTTPQGGWKATTLPKLGWPAKVRGKIGQDLENPTLEALLK